MRISLLHSRVPRLLTGLLVALAAVTATIPLAEGAARVLDADGDVYVIDAGTYGELFPDGRASEPGDPVLAVTVLRSDGSAERTLVPGTEGPGTERLAAAVLGVEGLLYVLWESDAETARLRLGIHAGDWNETVDVSRGSAVRPGSARAAVTHDSARLTGEGGETTSTRRSILNVIWVEDGAGESDVVYAPLVIEDGAYIGEHSLHPLGAFVPPAAAEGAEPAAAAVRIAPAIEPGRGGRTALVALVDEATDRLVTFELQPVSRELSDLGDGLARELLSLISRLEPGSPDSLGQLAAGARAYVLDAGRDLEAAVVEALGTGIDRYVRETGGDWAFQPDAMAGRTRARLIELGGSFERGSISRLHGGRRAQLIDIGVRYVPDRRSHDVRVMAVSARSLPPATAPAVCTVYLSNQAEEALIAWEDEGAVYFQESRNDGWDDPQALGIGADEDPELIRGLLRERIRSR